MKINILEVSSKKDLKKFIDFPHTLYKGDPNYVPELHIAVKEHLSEKKNPYFLHSKVQLFLAYQGDSIVGRIAVTVNNRYNEYHGSNVGFFGFFDVINDIHVASALLSKAEEILKAQSISAILGPTNLTTNDTAGILVEGFDRPPVVQMTYNKPYYVDLLEQLGYVKDMDLYAYKLHTENVNKKALRLTGMIQERLKKQGITIRNVNMKKFDQEAANIRKIYNAAWEKNWGFVPPTEKEFDFLAEGLKMIVNEKTTYIAEENGEMVAFAVGLPNINEILINNKKGRLFPTGIFKLLLGKNKTKSLRIVLLGVKEEFRKKGIEAVFFARFIEAGIEMKIDFAEASWILENNVMMRQAAENLNGTKYKTYRIYTKTLSN